MLAALMAANGVGSRAATAFENRLKHLKRNGFPAGANLGKTGRYDYTAADVAGIAAAVRLIDAYVMPTTAIQMVTSGAAPLAMLALDTVVPTLMPEVARDGEAESGDDESPKGPEPEPTRDAFAPRRYALFRGSALSELGERAAGAGRYDAPVGDALLLSANQLDGEAGAVGSGVLLNGPATFGPLADELDRRGFGRRALAAGLLASLSPRDAAAAGADVADAPPDLRPGLWHLSMLLRAVEGFQPGERPDARARIVAHHARLLLHEGGAGAAAAMEIGGASGTTVIEVVLELLDQLDFPDIGRPSGWPVSRFLELANEARLPVGEPETLRRRLLEQVPLLARSGSGRH